MNSIPNGNFAITIWGISRHKHCKGYLCLMLLLLAYASVLPMACKCWITCHTMYNC